MAANPEFVAFITDQLTPMGALTSGRFFGGHALKSRGAQFAMIMGDTLYFRVDEDIVSSFEARGSVPFSYSTKRGRVFVRKYYSVPEDLVDDRDELLAWARRALDSAQKK